ncbi:MAG: ABC transporter permease subunit [Tissierellia bacterium]|nr:ABC transporter permease subunit [Tissierellia bacterium]
MKRAVSILLLITIILTTIVGCSKEAKTDRVISFADAGWDSIRFHNAVAATIIEELWGYSWTEITGSTPVTHQGLLSGEIDVHMEIWSANIASYEEDKAEDRFQELSTNFNDNYQGIYVPRYVIEGDPERGIEPLAPDLKYVWDLKDYPHIFKDDENPGMGRIYGAIPGWEVDQILYNKYLHYGLDENFIYFRPGSDASLAAAITAAYERGEPIAAYYWEPTWLLGMYDMVLLQDEPYNPDTYLEGETEIPPVNVTIGVSNDFYQEGHEEVVEFLSNYQTSSALTSEALAYMQETGADYIDTAKWFLQEHSELIDQWLKPEDAEKIKASLGEAGERGIKTSWLYSFPFELSLDLSSIDDGVKALSIRFDDFFTILKNGLGNFVGFINNILDLIPWSVMILLVVILTWRISGKITSGLLYGFFLFLIGTLGLWSMMNETLSIIIASVIVSLLLGFPIGILLSTSDRLDRFFRPILDTMQTMPVFVYLIPAMMFFGLGKPPAVIATTVYAVVPMIRLTNHGIRQIDKEVVEASLAFGSTKIQSLIKVQIPQALPTIMTGINQTLMMAMSMVVTTSMIGASGLGMEVLLAVNRVEMGRGLVSGVAVVIIAIILDRITQGLVKRSEVKADVE